MTEKQLKRVSQGQYQGWVMSGKDRNERRERLAQVPESMRAEVEAHVRTAFSLKKNP